MCFFLCWNTSATLCGYCISYNPDFQLKAESQPLFGVLLRGEKERLKHITLFRHTGRNEMERFNFVSDCGTRRTNYSLIFREHTPPTFTYSSTNKYTPLPHICQHPLSYPEYTFTVWTHLVVCIHCTASSYKDKCEAEPQPCFESACWD